MARRDVFNVEVEGNLVSEPQLATDTKGRTVAYAKIATNPYAQEDASDEEKHRLRSVLDLKFPKESVARKFVQALAKGDRVVLIGQGSHRDAPLLMFSKDEGKYATVDIDWEGEEVQVRAPRFTMRVHRFTKITRGEHGNHEMQIA